MVETSRDGSAQAELRKAIADLISVKIHDALAHADRLNRLLAHRLSGVASPQIRNAEQRLDRAIASTIADRHLTSSICRMKPGSGP